MGVGIDNWERSQWAGGGREEEECCGGGGGFVGGKSKTGKYVRHDTAKKTWTTERQKNRRKYEKRHRKKERMEAQK